MKRRDDRAAAGVVGAIIMLAVLSMALVYVNGVHVPRQGAALETAGVEETTASLLALAGDLAGAPDGPLSQDVPLRPDLPLPPLLSGIVLSPARATGTLESTPSGSNLTLSVVRDAPSTGVPVGDPTRVDLGGGKMRLYLLGNATSGVPLGMLRATVGGAYLDPAVLRVEGGALLSTREGASSAIAPPALSVERDTMTRVSWRLPLLAGESVVGGGSLAQASLTPGPEAQASSGRVYNLTIKIDTDATSAWRDALDVVGGSSAFVNVTSVGAPDNGTVEATLVAPPGTPSTTRGVELDLWVVRHEVALSERATG